MSLRVLAAGGALRHPLLALTPATSSGAVLPTGQTTLQEVDRILMAVLALGCAAAAVVWARSSRRLVRAHRRLRNEAAADRISEESLAVSLAAVRKDVQTTALYGVLAIAAAVAAVLDTTVLAIPFAAALIPALVALRYGRSFRDAARLAEQRSRLESRAEEVLAQEQLAPMRWSARLAPGNLPAIEGFEVGQVYQPGTGAMAGDFYDLVETGQSRLATVIGDVTGHGIEPSITAFQVKYLLRVFLREYRDPAQAMEELNFVLSAQGRPEELVSLCCVVFDTAAGTLRYASAGHPPSWLWHDGEVQPLRSTGPLLVLDPKAAYFSREVPLEPGDLLVLYTDGLTESRDGDALFGEDRIASIIRRDPGEDVTTLCKLLLGAAQDFASGPLIDDVAILAVRRS